MINTLSITLLKAILLAALILCFSAISPALANSPPAKPVLAFSDLVNGPATGLGDGLGEGAIVTVWGYHFGEQQGQVFFTDSTGQTRPAAHIYYWKKADGKLPGGPANLYKSHTLYEVAFSLPNASLGDGKITLQTPDNSYSNTLPFHVVKGSIFHIKSNGNNKHEGSFNSPWQFINGDSTRVFAAGNGKLNAGDIVYFHGTTEKLEPELGQKGRAAIFLRSLKGQADAHISLISFPGTQTLVESPTWGIHPYLSTGILIAKFTVKGGQIADPLDNSQTVAPKSPSTVQISATKNGRIIGNALTDIDGRCSNGYGGAIVSSDISMDNLKVIGNEIFNIGCRQTSHFHHTTYFTRRTQTGAAPIQAAEVGWNYLHDNMAKFGIHFYDQTNSSSSLCDQVTGTLKIHNNLIVNQRSVAISVRTASANKTKPCWVMDTKIYNNVILRVGLGPIAELRNGTQPFAFLLGGEIAGTFHVFNNLISGVADDESRKYGSPVIVNFSKNQWNSSLLFFNNIIKTDEFIPLFSNDGFNAIKNIIYYHSNDNLLQRLYKNVSETYLRNNLVVDPKIKFNDIISLEDGSPAIGAGEITREFIYDYYGNKISEAKANIGPFQ